MKNSDIYGIVCWEGAGKMALHSFFFCVLYMIDFDSRLFFVSDGYDNRTTKE